jgi:hypothetical protein
LARPAYKKRVEQTQQSFPDPDELGESTDYHISFGD